MVEFDAGELGDVFEQASEPSHQLGESLRRAAVELGRQLGAQEALQRGETGAEAELRVQRAMAYAAWEYDGKPPDTGPYREEFNTSLVTELQQHLQRSGPDSKPTRKK